jgi:hypothetical protein
MAVPQPRARRRKALDAAGSTRRSARSGCAWAAGGKAVKTARTYTEAVQWFVAAT